MRGKQIAIVAKGSGISYSFDATNTKCYYMAKTLKSYGLNVAILSSTYYQQEPITKKVGRYGDVKYYMPCVHRKSTSRVKRLYLRFKYILKVVGFLVYLKKKWTRVHFIFDDNSIPFPFLLLLSWIGVIELIFNLEEWPLAKNIPYPKRLLSHLFIIFAFKTCRKLVCVSSYLIAQAEHFNKKAKVFKLPALTKFNQSKCDLEIDASNQDEIIRFLYCGNVGYSEVIFAILHAYENISGLKNDQMLELILILHGNTLQLQEISDYVRHSEYPIKIKTSLSEFDLFEEYSQASVLLAPLRLTVQDEARFPQKIAEYTALSKPIITTNVGDIGLYFQLEASAIISENFSVEELAKAMNFVINHRQELEKIGLAGNVVGKKYFDYTQYVAKFADFVTS